MRASKFWTLKLNYLFEDKTIITTTNIKCDFFLQKRKNHLSKTQGKDLLQMIMEVAFMSYLYPNK